MRDWLSSVGDGIGRLGGGLRRALPDVSLTRPAPVTVYLVHNGPEAEDYAILIDFHAFMPRASGAFSCAPSSASGPAAGLRAPCLRPAPPRSFAAEFDRLYGALAEEIVAERRARAERGWFGLGAPELGAGLGAALGAGWLATLVLWLGLSTGRAAWGEAGRILRAALRLRSGEERRAADLEARVAEKRAVVDAALREIEIRLHPRTLGACLGGPGAGAPHRHRPRCLAPARGGARPHAPPRPARPRARLVVSYSS